MYTKRIPSLLGPGGRFLLLVLVLLLALGPAPLALAEEKTESHPVPPLALAVSTTVGPGIQPAVRGESVPDPARETAPRASGFTGKT